MSRWNIIHLYTWIGLFTFSLQHPSHTSPSSACVQLTPRCLCRHYAELMGLHWGSELGREFDVCRDVKVFSVAEFVTKNAIRTPLAHICILSVPLIHDIAPQVSAAACILPVKPRLLSCLPVDYLFLKSWICRRRARARMRSNRGAMIDSWLGWAIWCTIVMNSFWSYMTEFLRRNDICLQAQASGYQRLSRRHWLTLTWCLPDNWDRMNIDSRA